MESKLLVIVYYQGGSHGYQNCTDVVIGDGCIDFTDSDGNRRVTNLPYMVISEKTTPE